MLMRRKKTVETKNVFMNEQFQALLGAIKGNATEMKSDLTALENTLDSKLDAKIGVLDD